MALRTSPPTVAAVVAAHNEAQRIDEVLRVLTTYPGFDEVVVVDDGSTDGTAEVVERHGVTCLRLPTNQGKGAALDAGVRHAGTDVLFFADADIRGLDHATIDALIGPVADGEVDLFVAMRHRSLYHLRSVLRFLPLLGGERAVSAKLWHALPDGYRRRFKVEAALNFYAVHHGRGLRYRVFPIEQTLKEVKYGFVGGLVRRLRMTANVAVAIVQLQLSRLRERPEPSASVPPRRARRAPCRAGAMPPLDYRLREVDGLRVLALETAGAGRIVEVLGDLERAHAVAVVVPGNAHDLAGYLTETGGAAPRANGQRLLAAMREVAPDTPSAVVVWLGYGCPRGFVAGARSAAARAGAADLARLTHVLPAGARVTLVGHSYGALVCAMAAGRDARVDELVALAAIGLGVDHATQLRTTARVWAVRGADDWVRWLPSGSIGGFGHGRQPTRRDFGASTFSIAGARGHSDYYAPGSESLRNLARIATGQPVT